MKQPQILAFNTNIELPLNNSDLPDTPPNPDLKQSHLWGCLLSPEAEENTTNAIITLKNLHDAGIRTFAIIPLTPATLIQSFGHFAAVMPHTTLIQFSACDCQPIPTDELRLFIDTVTDHLDNSVIVYFTDNLLHQAGIPRAQLPASCIPANFFSVRYKP